jgi:ribose 5-phosphate isomerase A
MTNGRKRPLRGATVFYTSPAKGDHDKSLTCSPASTHHMDFKREAARVAYTRIKNHSTVGLGDGSTIRWLADFITEGIKNGLEVDLYTSSSTTKTHLQAAGVIVQNIAGVSELDQYFDGCDQVDHAFNAFKSGSGIHTSEKLLASMAKEFILLAEESKYVSRLDNRFPLVLEVIPESLLFVSKKMKSVFPGVTVSVRYSETGEPMTTRYGNILADCRFPVMPELDKLQDDSKSITGVVEISLFYKLAHGAIIAGTDGTSIYGIQN